MGVSMDQTAIATLPLVGAIVGAGLQYWFGRSLENRKQMALQRVQAYSDYFKGAAMLSKQTRSGETVTFATDAKIRVCLYGSSAVIKRLHDLEVAGNNLATPTGSAAAVALLAEMRTDAGGEMVSASEDMLRAILLGTGVQPHG
jgi:hypothetical protein